MNSLNECLANIKEAAAQLSARKIVVYTAIMGDYDELLDPFSHEEDVSYVCFTDSEKLRSTTWNLVHVPVQYRDPRRTAKIYKMYPHLLFPKSDISIWIDGSCRVMGSLTSFLDSYLDSDCSFACFPHPRRTTAREEREACKRYRKDEVKLIDEQGNDYVTEQFPDAEQLIAGGVLIRRHMRPDVIQFDELWYREVDKYSVRDLLSFNYLAWRQDFVYALIPLSLIDNGVFAWVPHRTLRFYDKDGNVIFGLRPLIESIYSKLKFHWQSR
jgi:hypothetical protein